MKLARSPVAFFRDSWLNIFRSKRPAEAWTSRPRTSSKPTGVEARYARLLESVPIEERVILYESFHGSTMSCNPLALFLELVREPEFADYRHVWVLNDRRRCTVGRGLSANVEFVKVHGAAYLHYLASAKYLVNNTSFPPYFQRREGQIYLNTWHGTPWKTLGRDMRGTLGQHKNIQRNLLQATHLLSQSPYMTERVLTSHDLDGIYAGKVLESGHPRVDVTLAAEPSEVRRKLAISSTKPILLIAPTWRGEVDKVSKVDGGFIAGMVRLCAELGDRYELLFRGHALEHKHLASLELPCAVVPDDIDTNELLGAVDCLVTDYSSILFDFLALGRPVFLFAYDLAAYQRERGLYFGVEEVPAYLCQTVDELVDAVRNRDWRRDFEALHSSFRQRFLPMDDGRAASRVIRAVWHGDESGAIGVEDHTRKNLLFYCGGFSNNGVTSSALSLFSQLDYGKYNVIVVDGGETDPERQRNLRRLPRQVRVFFRVGGCNTRPPEARVLSQYHSSGNLDEESESQLRLHFHRERRRLLGDTRIDVAIDFSGYVKFWTLFLGLGRFPHRVIYQHNDMLAENSKVVAGKYKHRENFKVIFDAYRFFDRVVSVSRQTRDLNYASLRSFVDESKSTFEYVTNAIDAELIRIRARESRELTLSGERLWYDRLETSDRGGKVARLHPVPSPDRVNFVHIGRFSPEKRHDRLLEAFAEVRRRAPGAMLYLLGDGVLFSAIDTRVRRMELDRDVVLLGQVDNPYWFLQRCDCLVLSSDHEGQPMVLLEALVLGRSVVATDIVGSRSVLGDEYGLLVPSSIEGLVSGMMQYIAGGVPARPFDAEAYRECAMARFYRVVCNEGDASVVQTVAGSSTEMPCSRARLPELELALACRPAQAQRDA